MDSIGLLFLGMFIGSLIGYTISTLLLRPLIGNDYKIDADIKNKKGNLNDNIFKGVIGEKEPKKRLFNLKRKNNESSE